MQIAHIDMDAFYASVEIRDFPQLRDKPVVVGGRPETRGVVAAASYTARAYGIKSAMPMSQAVKACPELIIQPVRMEVYRAVSKQIRAIFARYADLIQPLSLDEAYLDISHHGEDSKSAIAIGKSIKKDIYNELYLTCSVGLAPNLFVAKLASDYRKPNGITYIGKDRIIAFLDPLPVARIYGVGKVSAQKLRENELFTIADIRAKGQNNLQTIIGQRHGFSLWQLINGIDKRKVRSNRATKSISRETTFSNNINDDEKLYETLMQQLNIVVDSLKKKELFAKTVNIKMRDTQFKTITRARSFSSATDDFDLISQLANELYYDTRKEHPVALRLIGIGVSNLSKGEQLKISL